MSKLSKIAKGIPIRMHNTTPYQIEQNNGQFSQLWCVSIARDGNTFYGAIVDPHTMLCYVEVMTLGVAQETVKGTFHQIVDNEEWNTVMRFFEDAKTFSTFLEQRDWIFSKQNGKLTPAAKKARNKIRGI